MQNHTSTSNRARLCHRVFSSPRNALAIRTFLGWLVLVCLPVQTFGQIDAFSTAGTGNWNVGATWGGGVIPHNTVANTYNAFISNGSTVNLNLARTINQLNVNNGGVLNFTNGNILTIVNNGQTGAGVINNLGSININSTGSITQLQFNGLSGTNFQLNGSGGVLTLSGGNSALIGGTNALLTQGAGHTIQGSGTVLNNGLAMINQGTIRARIGDNLRIDPPNVSVGGVFFQNDGLVQAQAGGTVTLVGTGGEFTGSGEYRAEVGGTIALTQNVTMRNSRLNGGGQFTLGSGSHTWQSVNHSSNNTLVQSGANLNLTTRLTNSGSLQIDSGASTARMTINGDTILDGGGAIRMMGPNARITGDTVGTFVNSNNTLSGTGLLGANALKIANQGTIQAGAGEVMTIDSRIDAGNPSLVTFNNSGLVRAFDGGRIVFNGTAGAIGGSGTYRAEANSIIEFTTNSRVFGGVYETQGNGQFLSSGNTNLGNIINLGNLSIGNASTSTLSGPVTNNGNIQVTSTGSPTNVSVQGTQTLSGTGSLTLAGGNSNITGTGSLTNGAGHTITGGGNIGSNTLAITNAGTITNTPGSSMTVGGNVQNTGTITAQQGAAPNLPTFSFVGPFLSNTGTIVNNLGSSVNVAGSFTNTGTVIVRPTSNNSPSFNFGGNVNQTNGGMVLYNGAWVRATSNSVPNFSGGFLAGVGTVRSNNFLFWGSASLRPGFSPGQLNFDGDLTWGDGGEIEFDLGIDALNSDFIAITGDLLKDGTGTYAFNFLENGIVLNQTYNLMSFDTTTFLLTDFSFSNGGGFAGDFSFNGSNNMLQFTVTAIPEPSSLVLLLGAASFAAIRRRRPVSIERAPNQE
jgi:hypothetical protein